MNGPEVSHSEPSSATATIDTEMPPFLTSDDMAARYRQPVATVRYWRHAGKGPKSARFGKRVLYAREDVLAWEAEIRAAGGGW